MGKGGGSIRHEEKLAFILVLIDRNCEEIEGDSQLQLCPVSAPSIRIDILDHTVVRP